jgi:4-hydroxy 2-oxovalerate aldolase
MKVSGIKNIELGFISLKRKKNMGLCYNLNGKSINALKIPKNLDIGCMINASDMISCNLKKKKLTHLVKYKNNLLFSFIRIACHVNEIEKIFIYLDEIKKLKIKLIINLMQISEYDDYQINRIVKKLAKKNVDVIYFADSLGCMNTRDVANITRKIKKNFKKDVGFHAHNNNMNAHTNVFSAIKNGVEWIDSTICGFGRGAGNAKTEYLLNTNFFTQNNIDRNYAIKKLINKRFLKLKEKYGWGCIKYYKLSAKFKIHPTYIQEISKKKNISDKKFLEIINFLNKQNTKMYNKDLLNNIMSVNK